jgi:hypothetical protein
VGHDLYAFDQTEPSSDDLAAIETEWPLIEAELMLLDAEIRVMTAEGGASDLDWRRVRRAKARVVREALAFYGKPSAPTVARGAVA